MPPPTTDPAIRRGDHAGFVRTGPHQTPLDALARLLNGYSSYETPASLAARRSIEASNRTLTNHRAIPTAPGFVRDSEAWQDARLLDAPLIEIRLGPPRTRDLFGPAEHPRFTIDESFLDYPLALGGPPPAGYEQPPYPLLEPFVGAFAWDEERVLLHCPRGACLVPRSRWERGIRSCPGC